MNRLTKLERDKPVVLRPMAGVDIDDAIGEGIKVATFLNCAVTFEHNSRWVTVYFNSDPVLVRERWKKELDSIGSEEARRIRRDQ